MFVSLAPSSLPSLNQIHKRLPEGMGAAECERSTQAQGQGAVTARWHGHVRLRNGCTRLPLEGQACSDTGGCGRSQQQAGWESSHAARITVVKGKRQLSGWERAQGLSGSRQGSMTTVSTPPNLSTLSPKSKHLLTAVRAEETGCVNAAGVLPHQSGEPNMN